jgi:hypothetical protein
VLPADTEPEDVFDMNRVVPIVTQTSEWDEDDSLPPFGSQITSFVLEEDEARDRVESTFAQFSRNVLGNSSAVASDDSDVPQGEHTPVITRGMKVVSDDEQEEPEPEVTTMPTIEFKPWSGNWTWPQALEADHLEKAERQPFDLEIGWMKDADHSLLGHQPAPGSLRLS